MKQKTPPRNKLFYVGMAIGFALAFAVLWLAMPYIQNATGGGVRGAVARAQQIDQAALGNFFRALEKKDFPAMQKIGGDVFKNGRVWSDAKKRLAEYEINSLPPYRVYAFYTHNTDKKTQRVLLTIDEDEKIVSFLAEEMPVL